MIARIRHNWKHNRKWVLIVVALSLAGALLALVVGRYGTAIYTYTPGYYEPKDEERGQRLEQLERARQGGEQPSRSR